MFPLRKVLSPIDYSEPCIKAVPYVKEAVQRFSAELTLIHAYGEALVFYGEVAMVDTELTNKLRDFEAHRLQDFARETFPGQRVESFARVGGPGRVIHDFIERQGTDLVMMPTHGHGPIRRMLVGSVAAQVLHDVSAAVWTTPSSALLERSPKIPYKSILCAVDNSDEWEAVLKAGAAIASEYGAEMSVVQVIDIPPGTIEIDFNAFRQGIMDATNSRLRELKGRLQIQAQHAVLDGMIADGVRQEALRQKADLIVTGRGRAQATFASVWSHLYQIVREAPCPVLSI